MHSIPPFRPHTLSGNIQQKKVFSSPPQGEALRFGRERHWILPEDRYESFNSSSQSGDVELLRDVIEYVKEGKFKLNGHAGSGGWTPVHRAAGLGNLNWLKVAHEEGGADLWVKTDDGSLPVDIARKGGFTEIVEYLEAQHAKGTANPSEKKKGFSGFCRKVWTGLQKVAKALYQSILVPLQWLWTKMRSWVN